MQHFRFEGFSFEVETGQLRHGPSEIRITPKAAAVLGVLLKNAGSTVTKDKLFSSVWSETSVSDDALTSCIQELRRALGDDPRQPRYIETRHRRGYRFLSLLELPTKSGEPAEGAVAIAVLPFTDISPKHDQDYFCDGLATELISAFSQIRGLRVVSRTASFQFRAPGADVRSIGSHLGVTYLVEGSIRKTQDRLRVIVELIDVASGYHKWSQQFNRSPEDIFAIQDEISEGVINTLLGGTLTGVERQALQRPQTGTAAYEYYLRGLQFLPRMTQPDLARSAEMFERSLEIDSSYGPALAGLATVFGTLYEWFGADDQDLKRAEDASRKAVALAPELAEARVARGFTASLAQQYQQAVHEFGEAIRINPNLFEAYYYFARASFANGEIARSAELFAKAAEVRREDYQSPILLAQSLRMQGRLNQALEADREGIRRAERALALDFKDPRALSLGAQALFQDGQKRRAQEWSRRAVGLCPEDMATLYCAACLNAKLGRKEEALDLLERIFARGWGKRGWIENDPDYDILRSEPRFRNLLATLT
ncbi:MAG: winged helix-turn-helix domain-containing protein [Bryobacteraceae bacterium]